MKAELARVGEGYYLLMFGGTCISNIFIRKRQRKPPAYQAGTVRAKTQAARYAIRVYPDSPHAWAGRSMPILEVLQFLWSLGIDTRNFVKEYEKLGWEWEE